MFRFSLTKPILLCLFSVVMTLSMACKKDSTAAAEPATEDPMSGGAVDDISALVKEDIPGTNMQYARQLNPQGQIQIEGFVENGKKTGQWIEYTPEGDILLINHYVNGLLEGTVLRMTYRNQVDLRINYKQGKMDGQYTAYKFGKLVEERFIKTASWKVPPKPMMTGHLISNRKYNIKTACRTAISGITTRTAMSRWSTSIKTGKSLAEALSSLRSRLLGPVEKNRPYLFGGAITYYKKV